MRRKRYYSRTKFVNGSFGLMGQEVTGLAATCWLNSKRCHAWSLPCQTMVETMADSAGSGAKDEDMLTALAKARRIQC